MRQFIYLFFVCSIWITACNKDVIQEPPCGNYVRPTAQIYLDPNLGPTPNNDHLTVWRILQFRSDFTDTSRYRHTWYLGAETLSVAKFWRDFRSETEPKTYTVYHAMHWTPNKQCDPLDNGYDSTSFTFTITNKYNDLNVLGKYRVAYDSLPYDSIDIEFYFSKLNQRDSVVLNPMQGDFGGPYDGDLGGGYTIMLIFKGLTLPDYQNKMRLIKEIVPGGVVSDNFIIIENDPGSLSGPGGLSLNPLTKKCTLTFKYRTKYYSLKGRKL